MPLAPSLDHIGPLARCVRDLALMMRVLADPGRPAHGGGFLQDYVAVLDSPRFAPPLTPRLGRLRGLFDHRAEPSVAEMMRQVGARLEQKGATIFDVPEPAAFAEVLPRHRTIMAVEAAAYHQDRLRRHPDDYDPWIRTLLEEGLNCPAPEYARCQVHQKLLRSEMLSCFDGVDALLTPATTDSAPDAGSTGDPAFNAPWSYIGLPTISFPVGRAADGMPLAVQLVAPPWQESILFAVAGWCEDALAVTLGEPPLGA